jgi:DNA-binding MarR family transcriptional regulator
MIVRYRSILHLHPPQGRWLVFASGIDGDRWYRPGPQPERLGVLSKEVREAVAALKPLGFDPIAEARHQWIEHGWDDAADGMAVVTSLMRAQQIYLARVNAALRRFDLSFARFEALALLSFTTRGSLPLGKVGARLQVQPASVTHIVDRLEADGLVRRVPHESDRRATLVEILPPGRAVFDEAVEVLNEEVFSDPGVPAAEARVLVELISVIRLAEGDFVV